MAEAGFYWCGSTREPDIVACFICGKILDGWEPQDDPWTEHRQHAPQCAFVKIGRSENQLTVSRVTKRDETSDSISICAHFYFN